MIFYKALECGLPLNIVLRDIDMKKMMQTCFRGLDVQKAGNFFRWQSMDRLLQDSHVMEEFVSELTYLWKEKLFGNHSVTIQHPEFVGWEGTDDMYLYSDSEREPYEPKGGWWGEQVGSRVDRFAPRTTAITLVFEFKQERLTPTAVILDAYPGVDIGPLKDDVTARTKRVFFGRNYPGA